VATSTNFNLYSADSPWKQRVDGPDVQADPSSALRMSMLQKAVNAHIAAGNPGAEVGAENSIYIVDSRTTPLVPVYVGDPDLSYHSLLNSMLIKGVPIPESALPGTNSDHHLSIYDTHTDTLYDFWRACPPHIDPSLQTIFSQCPYNSTPPNPTGQWQVRFGGVMQHASQRLGYYQNVCTGLDGQTLYNPKSSSSCVAGSTVEQSNWGATATSLPVSAGTMTIDELKSGHINHAINAQLPFAPLSGHDVLCYGSTAAATPFAWPAQRSDGSSKLPDCIPEGARLRIDPNLDLSKLKLPKEARMVAEAAQKYGIIVNDRTAVAVDFYAETATPYQQRGDTINPYTGNPWGSSANSTPDSIYGGVPIYAQFKGTSVNGVRYDPFPWDHVQVVKMNICHTFTCDISNTKPAPAPTTQPPTISLASPTRLDPLVSGTPINFTATASDSDGIVAKVEFFVGQTKVGEDTIAPYTGSWTAPKSGSYILYAQATDDKGLAVQTEAFSVGVGTGSAPSPPPVDTTPPQTAITSNPSSSTTDTSANFTFNSTENNSIFQCKLDAAAFSSCDLPQSYSGLSSGSHTFSVEATDPAGNIDATPATYKWTITTTPLPPPAKVGDVNNDGKVDILDISVLLSNFSKATASCDLNKDGTVNVFDLSILLSHYGT
jgi:hypothetical protein